MTNQNHTADLPMPGAGPLMQSVPVLSIARSLTNQRKHFDPAKLQELADSIKATGVLQPILIRPLPVDRIKDEMAWARAEKREPAQYELVCGERRWRASQLAEVLEIPAVIRPLSDAQALKAQVIENLQRADITELEEAEGYEKLMESQSINADQLGAEVGKSRSYIYGRLKLLDLCEKAREALRTGDIDYSKGLLIARIPDESLQLKALAYCAQKNYAGDPIGYRACAEHVQQNYMLKLSGAPFKITDAELLPRAGSCKECPKRTGAQADLYHDVASADVCTDPKCYHDKEEAHAIAIKRAAVERGQTIIEGREAKALMPNSWSSEVKGYLRLDDRNDSPTDKPLRKLIGKAMERRGIQPTLVANPHKDGQLVAVLTSDQVETLLKDADNEEVAAKVKADAERDAEAKVRQEEAAAKTRYEEQWRWDLLTSTWQQICNGTHETPSDAVLRLIASNCAKGYSQDRAKKLCKLLDLGKVAPQAGLLQYIAETDAPGDVLQLLIMYGDVEYRYWMGEDKANEGLLLVAQEFGVDVKTVKAKTRANQRAAESTKKQQEAKKASQSTQSADSLKPQETSSTPAPAAQAQKVRGGKKKTQVDEKPKLSAAAAQAAIAEAMQAAEAQSPAYAAEPRDADQGDIPGAAAAAQDDDAQAVADAQPATVTASEEAAPASTTEPPADTPAASGERIPLGSPVTIIRVALDPSLANWGGKTGNIYRDLGAKGYEVAMPHPKRGTKKFVKFAADQVQEVTHV